MAERFIRFLDGCRLLGIGRSTAYRRVQEDPDFPKIVKPLGPDSKPSAFVESDLVAYQAKRIAEAKAVAA
jgi:predicted DNA-binding transcriptional regulator AlpA